MTPEARMKLEKRNALEVAIQKPLVAAALSSLRGLGAMAVGEMEQSIKSQPLGKGKLGLQQFIMAQDAKKRAIDMGDLIRSRIGNNFDVGKYGQTLRTRANEQIGELYNLNAQIAQAEHSGLGRDNPEALAQLKALRDKKAQELAVNAANVDRMLNEFLKEMPR
jgi:hypothetical protein